MEPAFTTPTSVGVPVVVTSPPPLSPWQIALVGDDAQKTIPLSDSSRSEAEKSPQSPCGSIVAVIDASGPVSVSFGCSSPKPAVATVAPAGYGVPGAGSAIDCTAGPLRSSGAASVRTATSSGSAVST